MVLDPHLRDDLTFRCRLGELASLINRMAERLLAVHVLPQFHGSQRNGRVHVVGGRNRDGIDVVLIEQLSPIPVRLGSRKRFGGLAEPFVVDVADRNDVLADRRFVHVRPAFAAHANAGNTQTLVGSDRSQLPTDCDMHSRSQHGRLGQHLTTTDSTHFKVLPAKAGNLVTPCVLPGQGLTIPLSKANVIPAKTGGNTEDIQHVGHDDSRNRSESFATGCGWFPPAARPLSSPEPTNVARAWMMQHLPIGPLYYEYDRRHEPRLHVEPGETFRVDTEDAFSGQIRSNDDRRDKTTMPYSNPQTGPIWVRGAQPGDTLTVTIESIEPTLGQCATRTSDPSQLAQWLGDSCPHGTHICPIREGQIYWSPTLTIPYQPMLGCIGTAPAWGVPTTLPAGPHGGNLDLVEVRPGSTIQLPVAVEGALLYLGDAHAAMGHGELSASGLEMPSTATLTVDLIRQTSREGIRIESTTEIMTVASTCPMERAIAQAYAQLILWLEADYGWDRWQAYDLLTHVGRISVGYYAIGTVATKIAKRYLTR